MRTGLTEELEMGRKFLYWPMSKKFGTGRNLADKRKHA